MDSVLNSVSESGVLRVESIPSEGRSRYWCSPTNCFGPKCPLDPPPESRGPLQRTHYDADDKTGGHRVPAEFLTCSLIHARDFIRTIGVIPVRRKADAWMGGAFSHVEQRPALTAAEPPNC